MEMLLNLAERFQPYFGELYKKKQEITDRESDGR
jgi:hypothetical protein